MTSTIEFSEWSDWLRIHFFDSDRHEAMLREFPEQVNEMINIRGDASFLYRGFNIDDLKNKREVFSFLLFECSIPTEIYKTMFPNCDYTFPWLDKDEDGFILNPFIDDEPVYASYSDFEMDNGNLKVIHNPYETIRDIDLENSLKNIYEANIDLRKEPSDDIFKTNQCWVSSNIEKGTVVYDVLYYADFLLKFFWRYIEQIVIRNKSINETGLDDFLISKIPGKNGMYNLQRTARRPEFGDLGIIIQHFVNKNSDKITVWRSDYKATKQFIANLQYPEINYGIEQSRIHIGNLKPVIQLQMIDGTEYPINGIGYVLKKFFEDYYENIKRVFTIFTRIERIYKIILCNRIINKLESEKSCEYKYTGNHSDSIEFHGGVNLGKPKILNQIPIPFLPFKPIIPQTTVVTNVKVARRRLHSDITPIAIGAVAHSGLILETNKGEKYLLDYDGKVHLQHFTNESEWKVQEKGESLDMKLSVEQIRDIMISHTSSQSYNAHNHNCHLAQQRTRQALGLSVSNPYKPL